MTKSKRPDFWHWQSHIMRRWAPPAKVNGRSIDKCKIVGFAVILASFGKDGTNLHPSAATLARRAHMSERWAKQLRKDAVTLGLFREIRGTGPVQNLEIAIPASGTIMHDDEPEIEQSEGEPQFTPMHADQAEHDENASQFTGEGEPQFPPLAEPGTVDVMGGTTVHAGVNHSSPHREPQFTLSKEIIKEIIKETETDESVTEPKHVVMGDDWPEPEPYEDDDDYGYPSEPEPSRFSSSARSGYLARQSLSDRL